MNFMDRAKEKAGELANKAGPGAAKGLDSAKGQLDKATGGKYHDHIENASGKVHEALQKAQGWNEQDSSPGSAGSGETGGSSSSQTGNSQPGGSQTGNSQGGNSQ